MNFRQIAFALLLSSVGLGCSGAREDEQEGDVRQAAMALGEDTALDEGDFAPSGSAYKILSYDTSTSTLTAVGARGESLVGTLSLNTAFRTAKLDQYAPVDPCRQAAANYNNAPLSFDGLNSSLTAFASLGCSAKIKLTQGTIAIRAFRPVP